MRKVSSAPPKMGNNGGTAFVRLHGKRIYLGKYGSPEAVQNYARRIAEWSAFPAPTLPAGSQTIDTLVVAFLDYAKENYGTPDYNNCRIATRILLKIYSGYNTEAFTPKCLMVVQKQCTEQKTKFKGKPYSRQYCNKLIGKIKTMFRWGVTQELVPASVSGGLSCVPALRKGKTKAPETDPRLDVPDEIVQKTLPHLPSTVAAMVQVQREACMRPNEVCRMRVGDIDTSGDIWMYCLKDHKTVWRGHSKIVPLGKPEQEIIAPRLIGKSPEQAVFSPKEAMGERFAKRKSKISKARIKQREEYLRKRVKEFYTSETYNNVIQWVINKVNRSLPKEEQIPRWTPYQLRHAAVTENVIKYGLDVARAVAGQKTLAVTTDYNHGDIKVAIEVAKKRTIK